MGCIYVLTNKSYEGQIKVGYAEDLDVLLGRLNNGISNPYPFEVYGTYDREGVLTDEEVKALLGIGGKAVGNGFYSLQPESVFKKLEMVAKVSGTEERLKKAEEPGTEVELVVVPKGANSKRAANFKFSMCHIKPGDIISFVGDRTKKAVVIDDERVRYLVDNKIYKLSPLAEKLMHKNSLQGPLFFEYMGKVLTDLRREMGN